MRGMALPLGESQLRSKACEGSGKAIAQPALYIRRLDDKLSESVCHEAIHDEDDDGHGHECRTYVRGPVASTAGRNRARDTAQPAGDGNPIPQGDRAKRTVCHPKARGLPHQAATTPTPAQVRCEQVACSSRPSGQRGQDSLSSRIGGHYRRLRHGDQRRNLAPTSCAVRHTADRSTSALTLEPVERNVESTSTRLDVCFTVVRQRQLCREKVDEGET